MQRENGGGDLYKLHTKHKTQRRRANARYFTPSCESEQARAAKTFLRFRC